MPLRGRSQALDSQEGRAKRKSVLPATIEYEVEFKGPESPKPDPKVEADTNYRSQTHASWRREPALLAGILRQAGAAQGGQDHSSKPGASIRAAHLELLYGRKRRSRQIDRQQRLHGAFERAA